MRPTQGFLLFLNYKKGWMYFIVIVLSAYFHCYLLCLFFYIMLIKYRQLIKEALPYWMLKKCHSF